MVSSDRLEKFGISPVTPDLQGEWFIHGSFCPRAKGLSLCHYNIWMGGKYFMVDVPVIVVAPEIVVWWKSVHNCLTSRN